MKANSLPWWILSNVYQTDVFDGKSIDDKYLTDSFDNLKISISLIIAIIYISFSILDNEIRIVMVDKKLK